MRTSKPLIKESREPFPRQPKLWRPEEEGIPREPFRGSRRNCFDSKQRALNSSESPPKIHSKTLAAPYAFARKATLEARPSLGARTRPPSRGFFAQPKHSFAKRETLLSNRFQKHSAAFRTGPGPARSKVADPGPRNRSPREKPQRPRILSLAAPSEALPAEPSFFNDSEKLFHSAQTKRFNRFQVPCDAPGRAKHSKSLSANFKPDRAANSCGGPPLGQAQKYKMASATGKAFAQRERRRLGCAWLSRALETKARERGFQFLLALQRKAHAKRSREAQTGESPEGK